MSERILENRLLVAFFGLILFILFIQAVFPAREKKVEITEQEQEDCMGEPLHVPYAYTGNVVEPWSCKPQCDDGRQRYLVYTNGVATQCEELPGCNDSGEDHGVTCRMPTKTPLSATSK